MTQRDRGSDCDPEGQIFLSVPHTNNKLNSFSCIPFISENGILIMQSVQMQTSDILR